jgi:hypothetical protein
MDTYVKCIDVGPTAHLTLGKVYKRIQWGQNITMVANDVGNHAEYDARLFSDPFTDVADTPRKFQYTIDLLKDQLAVVVRDQRVLRNRINADGRALHASILTEINLNNELMELQLEKDHE